MTSRKIALAMAALAVAAQVQPAAAATVTACGPSVCYEYDNAQAAILLYGLPTLVGDAMQFNPTSFRAESANGAGLVVTSATFVFDRVYTSDSADEITALSVSEVFDYEVIGQSWDYVQATLNLTAANPAYTPVSVTSFQNFAVAGDTGGALVGGLTGVIYPGAQFTAPPGPKNDMEVSITNILQAYTLNPGELAWIQKKFTLSTATVMNNVVVPVPAAAWLLGSAVGLLGWMRRRAA